MDTTEAPNPAAPQKDGLTIAVEVIFGAVAIVVGIGLGFFNALIWSGGLWNAEVFGYALGFLLFPVLIAYAIAGRRKVRNCALAIRAI